jgi:thiosulfate reductase cytochrome b subunit
MSRLYLYSLPLRIWHWANFIIIIILCVTGIQLRIPEAEIFRHYAWAVALHKYFGFLLAGSFLFWFFYHLFTGGLIKHYLIRRRYLRGMGDQALYYAVGVFRGARNPFTPSLDAKFNALQRISYLSVMFLLVPAVTITGILFSDVLYFLDWIKVFGGIRNLDALHVVIGYMIALFLLVHVYMTTLGHTVIAHTKTMITGYQEEEEGEERDDPAED